MDFLSGVEFPLPIAKMPVRVRVKTCLFGPPASHTGTPYWFTGVVHLPLGPRYEVVPGYQAASSWLHAWGYSLICPGTTGQPPPVVFG